MTMNGLRLGTFQILTNLGYTTTPTGEYSIPRNIAASAVAGGLATWVGSPFYLVGFFVHRFFLLLLCQTSVTVSLWVFFVGFYFQNRDVVRYVYITCWRIECNKLM